ncbi:hypothetical protein B0J11DRAFT_143606 [Dendryphion nanum]|uniref:Uncharacterized protein n=1 Tax=Dendryphion nanum TaxID=256645 RepID=A0A9P9D6A7_9PLEO|nr:hypothetical protein B0J11DRAFT_143606 [Dendryphion nanum]
MTVVTGTILSDIFDDKNPGAADNQSSKFAERLTSEHKRLLIESIAINCRLFPFTANNCSGGRLLVEHNVSQMLIPTYQIEFQISKRYLWNLLSANVVDKRVDNTSEWTIQASGQPHQLFATRHTLTTMALLSTTQLPCNEADILLAIQAINQDQIESEYRAASTFNVPEQHSAADALEFNYDAIASLNQRSLPSKKRR